MKRRHNLKYQFVFLLSVAFLAGCGKSGVAPVSGTVTVNGKPMANVRVIFAPKSTPDTIEPGPPSFGVTDDQGRYELETKDGFAGAVVGTHDVTFYYDDLEHLEDLESWLSNAEDEDDAAAARAKIAEVESAIASRGAISSSAKQTVDVPEEGKEDADFEIGEGG